MNLPSHPARSEQVCASKTTPPSPLSPTLIEIAFTIVSSPTLRDEVMKGPMSAWFHRPSTQSFSPVVPQWPPLPPSRPGSGGRTLPCSLGGSCLGGSSFLGTHGLPGRNVAFSVCSAGGSNEK